jgi:hypothetical protein
VEQILHWFVHYFYFALHLCIDNLLFNNLLLWLLVLMILWTFGLKVTNLPEMVFLEFSTVSIEQVSIQISFLSTNCLNLLNIYLPIYYKRRLVYKFSI